MSEPGWPASLEVRPATAADVEAMTAVFAAGELAANGTVDVDADDVATDLKAPLLASPDHAIVVADGVDVVATGLLHAGHGGVWACVQPDHRGRGIGSALLAWTERTASAAGVAKARQSLSDSDTTAVALLSANGYSPMWTSWLLEYRMTDDPPAQPDPPEGIAIRPFAEPADERMVYRLIQDAFGEWENHIPQTFEQWRAFGVDRGTFDALLSPVAEDVESGEVVGVALCLTYEEDEGYVHQLAVRADHRNRGIARALLLTAFGGFHDMGRRSVTLGTDSRTGALPMYERVGMLVRRSYTAYGKELGAELRDDQPGG
ncbi:MAG TPA: GNAT family N-acetyltransferase [Actinomycetota bacterium]|nr:GNAT family N-acetyltransferase [Actinomycetota bacterium]